MYIKAVHACFGSSPAIAPAVIADHDGILRPEPRLPKQTEKRGRRLFNARVARNKYRVKGRVQPKQMKLRAGKAGLRVCKQDHFLPAARSAPSTSAAPGNRPSRLSDSARNTRDISVA